MATPVNGSFSGTGQSGELLTATGKMVIDISGTFVADIYLQFYHESAGAWANTGDDVLNTPGRHNANVSLGGKYRLNCSSYTSGTAYYTLQEGRFS